MHNVAIEQAIIIFALHSIIGLRSSSRISCEKKSAKTYIQTSQLFVIRGSG